MSYYHLQNLLTVCLNSRDLILCCPCVRCCSSPGIHLVPLYCQQSALLGMLLSIVESLRDREVVCSASDLQGSNFESCVWRTVSSHSSHHPQEVLLAQFSLYVHKSGLKPDSFHFISFAGYAIAARFFACTASLISLPSRSRDFLVASVSHDSSHIWFP